MYAAASIPMTGQEDIRGFLGEAWFWIFFGILVAIAVILISVGRKDRNE
jgi:hypothetical protein